MFLYQLFLSSSILGWDLLSLVGAGASTSFSRPLSSSGAAQQSVVRLISEQKVDCFYEFIIFEASSTASFSFGMEVSGALFKRSSLEFWLEGEEGGQAEELFKVEKAITFPCKKV